MPERGKLTVYTGPMYADKTTELIREAKEVGDQCLVFKPSLDDRYGGDANLTYSKVPKDGVVSVGASDLYGAACENCYGRLSKSKS